MRLVVFLFIGLILMGCDKEPQDNKMDEKYIYYVLAPEIELREEQELKSPPGGVIPDPETAFNVAYAILSAAFEESSIKEQLPFLINEVDGVWVIRGAMLGGNRIGGTAEIAISKNTGEVVYLLHTQ